MHKEQIMNKEQIKKARQKYHTHKAGAKSRNIPFLFTFNEWLQFWIDSGKWELRGNKAGQYCMSRFNDSGPYSKENVFIQLSSKNTSDALAGKSNHLKGVVKSIAWRAKISSTLKGNIPVNKGIPHNDLTKQKISSSQKKRWEMIGG
jgi:hypothetical protein